MSYSIVFFDIDGTLINEDKQVPEDTVRAVSELKATGVEAVIATGRAPYFFKPIAEQLGIDSFISLNGAYVVYQGQVVYKRVIPRASLEKLVEHASRHKHSLVYQGDQFYYANSVGNPYVINSINTLKVDHPQYDPEFWKSADVFQAFLHCTEEEEAVYKDVFPDLRLVRWHPEAMDVMPIGGSKAQGIEFLLDSLNLKPSQAVAFGDGLNDIEMLSCVGLGIAMGNSHPKLFQYADYITSSVDEQGIRNGLIHAGLLAK
ncbi:Cof-type HAD-IIB family hydrolase [Paenibacillus senegalensis]|uniref:Cof-type HAD-IIB family hydrolase n=1 Tax=Paenibacillus senegalensis TaxID=1465766 RepID=UPI000288F331|nr:Cof-type HAD-IIB family hydrolase [Paenibacillus senegalensis]